MFIVICMFFIVVWLPAQWINGATFWESIAPDDPVMGTIWMLILGLIFFVVYLKIHDDNCMENEARANGWVDENATRTEAIVEYGRKEWERKNKLYELNVEMCELQRLGQKRLAQRVKESEEKHLTVKQQQEIYIKEDAWIFVRKSEIYDYLSKQKDYQINMYL